MINKGIAGSMTVIDKLVAAYWDVDEEILMIREEEGFEDDSDWVRDMDAAMETLESVIDEIKLGLNYEAS